MSVLIAVTAVLCVVIISAASFVYLAPESFTHWAINLDRRRAGLVRKEIDLPDGLHYVYLEGGAGEPLMLLHGFGGSKDNFARVARFLTPHYRVIIPDEFGFGESSHPQDADYHALAQAEHLHALTSALGINRLHVGGNSMGGQIALTYAARFPSEVISLWLLDTAGVWSAPKGEMMKIIEGGGRNPLLIQNEDDFAQVIKFLMNKPPFIPRPMLNVLARIRLKNLTLEQRIFRQFSSESVEKMVAGLPTPTMIVWGEKDRVFNVATAEVLHKLMPKSQVVIIPDTGHVPMMERPEQSAEAYLRFRESLGIPAQVESRQS